MPEDVIVCPRPSGVNQGEFPADRQPMLLSVVIPDFLPVLPSPQDRVGKIESVVTGGEVSFLVVPERQIIATVKADKRRFPESAWDRPF